MPQRSKCVACGKSVQMHSKTSRPQPCCLPCRRTLSRDEKLQLGIVKPRKQYKRIVQVPYSERKPKRQTCSRCNCKFLAKYTKRVYCDECLITVKGERKADPRKNQRKMSKRRAMLAKAFVEEVDPTMLFERDGWRCHICGRKCRRDVDNFHPKAPTIDHIIPLVAGGEHSYRNTACAHRYCNVSKGARDIGQQLAIVG